MTFEQAIEHYRKGCNIRISLDFIVDGWLTFKSGDEISVLPIHINSDRWQVYGLHGWVSQPIFTPENYHPGTTESREKMGDIIDKVFKILFSDIRGVLCKMPNSPSVEYIAGELHKIWGLVYVDIPKVTLKRIEEVRKEEKAKADTPCHNCITCHHYSNNNRCLISNSPVYALSVINCAVWKAKEQRVCGTCTYYKDSACHADFRHFCTMSPIESCSNWQSTCTTYTNKTTDNTKMFMTQINKLQTAVMEIRNKLGMNK